MVMDYRVDAQVNHENNFDKISFKQLQYNRNSLEFIYRVI